MHTPDPSVPAHWSSYWARGCLTSLPQDFQGNYDGEVAAFWQRQFERLPSAARILDVCTGNGAVALLAAEYGRRYRRAFAITGVDAAEIDPVTACSGDPSVAALAGMIDFIGGCRFETLDGSGEIDLIVSQYGIEYCDWDASARQVWRLLKPGGTLALVCHSVSSDVLATMEAEAAEYAQLQALNIMPALTAFAERRAGAADLRAVFARSAPALRRACQRTPSELYRYVLGMVDAVAGMDDAVVRQYESRLIETGRELRDGHARLEDMLRVNRRIAADAGWHRVFARHGLSALESGELRYQGRHRMGCFYRYRKPVGA